MTALQKQLQNESESREAVAKLIDAASSVSNDVSQSLKLLDDADVVLGKGHINEADAKNWQSQIKKIRTSLKG